MTKRTKPIRAKINFVGGQVVGSEILPPRQQPESEYEQIAYDVDRGTGIMLVELLKERDTYKEQRDLLFPLLGACKRAMDKAQQDRGDEAADILRTAITKVDKNLWEEKK